MRSLSKLFLTASVCGVLVAQAPKLPMDRAKIEAFLRHLELLPPEMAVTIGEPKQGHFKGFLDLPVEVSTPNGIYALRYFISTDGQTLVKGMLEDLTKPPFEAERKELKTELQPSFGPAGAPVTVVVYSDFQCPNCKEEAKILRDNLAKTFPKDVRVFFKDFPLEKLHPWAKQGAIAGRCAFRQQPTSFWDFHDWIYEHQAELSAENLKTKAIGWADSKNLDSAKLGQCIETKATEKEVDREIAEGRALGVSGTPTLFINGRPMTGAVQWQVLEQVVKRELEYAKKAAECCEVKIPGLTK